MNHTWLRVAGSQYVYIFFRSSTTRADTSASRRLNFETPNTYRPSTASSFYSRSTGSRVTDVFVPETPQRDTYDDMHWQPGQSLPTGPLPIASESGTSIELQSMLQSMQHTFKRGSLCYSGTKKKMRSVQGMHKCGLCPSLTVDCIFDVPTCMCKVPGLSWLRAELVMLLGRSVIFCAKETLICEPIISTIP